MQAQIDLEWTIQIIKYHPDIAIEEIARKTRRSISRTRKVVIELLGKGILLCRIALLENTKRLVYSLA